MTGNMRNWDLNLAPFSQRRFQSHGIFFQNSKIGLKITRMGDKYYGGLAKEIKQILNDNDT